MTLRDWRAGELTMLLLALVLAVAALSSVGFLADRLARGLARDARQMIGADLVVRADQPVDPRFVAMAAQLGLATAQTVAFPSMVSAAPVAISASASARPLSLLSVHPSSVQAPSANADVPTRLAAVKAVSSTYPLRGALELAAAPEQAGHAVKGIPVSGTVWIDPQLLDTLQLHIGGVLKLGERNFTVAALITREMDRGFAFVNFSPRVMLNLDDLASTGLITFGSRATYRLQISGSDAAVSRYTQWARQQLAGGQVRGVALETVGDGQPQVRDTLMRARHFLSLVAMLTALLAAVAIAMAAHRYVRRHLDGGAVMRCLGASRRTLRGLFVLEFVMLGVAGSSLGVLLGFVGHYVLLQWLGPLIGVSLPAAGWQPAIAGLASGLVLLLGFALPPLQVLVSVPPARVLRRELGGESRTVWLGYGLGLLLFGALLVSAAGELRLGLIVAGGFAGGLLGLSAVARLLLFVMARLARRASGWGGLGWRYALASMERRSALSVLQISALGIGLMCLLLLAITRNDLVAGWRASTPADAPNQFVIDIQPDQVDAVQAFLAGSGQTGVALAPMIRGRLIAIDGRAIGPNDYRDADARRLVDREFNLSYTTSLPADNRVVSGRWYGANGGVAEGATAGANGAANEAVTANRPANAAENGASNQPAEISMEVGIARSLHVKVGDVLRFDIAGQQIDAPVTSLRKLDWGSFRVNFFVLMPPAALSGFPATFITSFHLAANRHSTIDALVARFANLTVIDAGVLIAQLQSVLNQVIGAVQFLFVFTLAAGVLVLYAALAGSRDERVREAALLRALGASRQQIRRVQLTEFILVGGIAGLMAAVGAQALAYVLAERVFSFHLSFNPWLPGLGTAAGIACATITGWSGLQAVLRRPALQSLREGA